MSVDLSAFSGFFDICLVPDFGIRANRLKAVLHTSPGNVASGVASPAFRRTLNPLSPSHSANWVCPFVSECDLGR